MKLAIIGSRNSTVEDLEDYLPSGVTEIVSGGAKGIDTCAGSYARSHQITLKEIPPDYRRYGRGAPLIRNVQIIEYADEVLAFWDGKSRGTRFVIEKCQKLNKKVTVIIVPPVEEKSKA